MVTHTMRGTYETRPWHSRGLEATIAAFVPETLANFDERVSLLTAGRIADVEAELARATARLNRPVLAALLDARASARFEGYDVALAWHLDMRQRVRSHWDDMTALNESNLALVEAALVSAEMAMADFAANSPDPTPFSTALLHAWHGVLFHGINLHQREWVGRPRVRQCWIGGMSPMSAMFVPPAAHHVEPLLDDLAEFERRRVLSPLVAAFVNYAQFETIHPYSDGNGRTGRALIQYTLAVRCFSPHAVLVSPTLCAAHRSHIDLLVAWREGNSDEFWEKVIELGETAAWATHALASLIERTESRWAGQLDAVKAGQSARDLAATLIEEPSVNVVGAANRLGVSRPTAKRAIDALVKAEILEQTNPKRTRDRFWQPTRYVRDLWDWEGVNASR